MTVPIKGLAMFIPNHTPGGVFESDAYVERLRVRGPLPPADQPHFVAMGGADCYGRFLRRPFPAMLADHLTLPCRNLGAINAGLPVMQRLLSRGWITNQTQFCILQAPPVLQISNPFYTVHPYRNDRVVKLKTPFRRMFPHVDGVALNFVGHLWRHCAAEDKSAAMQMVRVLQTHWVESMVTLIRDIPCPVHVVHFQTDAAGPKIIHPMIAAIERVAPVHRVADQLPNLQDFVFQDWDRPILDTMVGKAAHEDAAAQLALAIGPRKNPI